MGTLTQKSGWTLDNVEPNGNKCDTSAETHNWPPCAEINDFILMWGTSLSMKYQCFPYKGLWRGIWTQAINVRTASSKEL